MKRVIALLILSGMIVSFSVPFLGNNNIEETVVNINTTAQEEMTEQSYLVINIPNLQEIVEEIKYEIENKEIEAIAMSNENMVYKEYLMPDNYGFKSYMSYRTITSINSPQYKLQNKYAYTGEYGIRQVNDRFCVAIGTFSEASVGTYIDLVLENGTVIPCVISDFKSNAHTDTTNMMTIHNNCVSEFIVDMNYLDSCAKRDGNISSCKEEWDSPVKMIRVYEKNMFIGE